MNKIIPYGKQFIDKEDIASLAKVLKSSFLTTGPIVDAFEKKINNYTGSKYALTCNSGTSALHLAFLAINTKP